METIQEKTATLSIEHDALIENLRNSIYIATKMTECLDNISQHHDDKTHTGFDSVQFHESTNEMLDKFTELFRKFNSEIYQSYRLLNVSGNGFNMKNFTHPAGDVRDYKENIMGQCVISNVKNVPDQHCYIIDTARPIMVLPKDQGARYTSLPEPGEVFAIDLGSDGLFRAVRNNFIFGEPKTIALCLIDTGEVIDIPFNYNNMYSLPHHIRSMDSCGILCKVIEVTGENGEKSDINMSLSQLLYEMVYFKIVKIENHNMLWIKIFLKSPYLDKLYSITSDMENMDNDSTSSSLNPFASEFVYPSKDGNEQNVLMNRYYDTLDAIDDSAIPLIEDNVNSNFITQNKKFPFLNPRSENSFGSSSLDSFETAKSLVMGYSKLSVGSDSESDMSSPPGSFEAIPSNADNLLKSDKKESNNSIVELSNPMPPLKSVSDLTPEQLEMLYEESMETSNALEAVMGYVPQDDQRICRFYDPQIKGCYKGARCRFEHVEMIKDGWTRDRSLMKIGIRAEQILPQTNQIIIIRPSYISSADDFYAHIPDLRERRSMSLQNLKEQLNKKGARAKYRIYNRFPVELELVFVLHNDSIYRARIVEVQEPIIKVFLVDYGPTLSVRLANLFDWDERWDYIPFQAYRCRLNKILKFQDKNFDVVKELKAQILNKPITANVLSASDVELVVQLIDEEGFDISDELCIRGNADSFERIFPTSNKTPG